MDESRSKLPVTLQAIGWTILSLLFPVLSGTIAVITELSALQTLLLQGVFMLLSLVLPWLYHRHNPSILSTYFRAPVSRKTHQMNLNFTLLISFLPFFVGGIKPLSLPQVLAILFFVIAVGIAEEVYFRGLILPLLNTRWDLKTSILLSSLLFGVGHFAGALSGASAGEVILTVVNATVFGLTAALLTVHTRSIRTAVIWHITFNLVNRLVLLDPTQIFWVGGIQIGAMLMYSIWPWQNLPEDQTSR